jgi:gamma-glutamyl-gamma-aminobutyrate hydrolase PuuD
MNEIVALNCLYFSSNYDVTLSLEKYISKYGNNLGKIVLNGGENSDPKFFLNSIYTQYFKLNHYNEFIYPVIQGFVEV